MTMSRKHYEMMADVIRRGATVTDPNRTDLSPRQAEYEKGIRYGVAYVAIHLADELGIDNPNFDRARFLRACGIFPIAC